MYTGSSPEQTIVRVMINFSHQDDITRTASYGRHHTAMNVRFIQFSSLSVVGSFSSRIMRQTTRMQLMGFWIETMVNNKAAWENFF
jgi:hypothetical protein